MRLVALLTLIGLLSVPAAALADETVPVSSLLANPGAFDQTVVTVRGEIVGDYGRRGDIVWVQVNDDPYVDLPLVQRTHPVGTNTGIAVRYPVAMQGDFGRPGVYRIRGPIVQVTGIFRHLDPETGGITYIQATDLTLLSASERVPIPAASPVPALVGAVLTLGGLYAMSRRRDMFPFVRW